MNTDLFIPNHVLLLLNLLLVLMSSAPGPSLWSVCFPKAFPPEVEWWLFPLFTPLVEQHQALCYVTLQFLPLQRQHISSWHCVGLGCVIGVGWCGCGDSTNRATDMPVGFGLASSTSGALQEKSPRQLLVQVGGETRHRSGPNRICFLWLW